MSRGGQGPDVGIGLVVMWGFLLLMAYGFVKLVWDAAVWVWSLFGG